MLPLAAYFVSSQLPLEDETFVVLLRGAWAFVAALLPAIGYAALFVRIRTRMDRTVFSYFRPKKDSRGKQTPDDLRDANEAIVTTVVEHDLSVWRTGLLKHLVASAVVLALQLYFKASTPMVIALATSPYGFVSSPLFLLHFSKKPATGDLARPFGASKKKASLLGDMRKQLAELSNDGGKGR